ncbi:MAG: peptide chain release factor N(5)-glutamine methyltransferase [Oscillospiraceae bacterium]|nr:peptide chain release factor N(5)-glutamine methyltransferase [Oscillospiraceae bacterium]
MEARNLVAFAAGKTLGELVRDYMLYASGEIEQKVNELVARRQKGEPLAYILGTWEFYGLELNVTPDVLIPRIDTEVLVQEAIDVLGNPDEPPRILDLCCGSGCIGVALGQHFHGSRVVMVDMSDNALRVARSNVMKHGMGARASCVKANALKVPPLNLGTFDMIVSNPPYIKALEVLTLDSSVRDFEPLEALDGGEDGYMFYRSITKKWRSVLREKGWLLFEVGEEQAQYVALQMKKAGFTNIRTVKDTAGTERVVVGQFTNPKKNPN